MLASIYKQGKVHCGPQQDEMSHLENSTHPSNYHVEIWKENSLCFPKLKLDNNQPNRILLKL